MRKVANYLLSYKFLIMLLFFLIFIQSISQLFLPTLMGDIVDNGVVKGDIAYIWKIGFVMLAVAAVGVFMSILISHFASKVAMGVGRKIREDIFTNVSDFSLHEFDTIGTASLITRTTNDVTQVQQATIMVLRMFLMAPFMLIGGLIMALSKDAKLSLVILIAIPFIALAILIILKRGYPLFQGVQKRLDRLNLVFRENLTGIRVIRSFAKGKEERARLKEANTDLTDISIKVNKLMAFTMPLMMLLMNVTVVFIIWFGGIRIDNGSMQIGDLMAFIQYVMLIMFALMMASMMFVVLPRATVSANRIREVLEMERLKLKQGDKRIDNGQGVLEFDHVTFYYPGADEPALEHIQFTAKQGEITAVIGGTGSGKTTLVQLIPRFFELTAGTIRLNGVDITETSLPQLREKIGFVPQKSLLFSGSINDNIRFGKQDATTEEIIHAATIAQANDFIEHLPEGYETMIEQGGANLSGGQKQRLSIVRALVRQPDIYIFDDSFSALDYKTDSKLRAALQAETKQSIVMVVAQRVSSVMHADQIIVLDKGKMVGIGTHEELVENNKVYQEIVASQLGEGEIA
ncbi:ABC transporter ATP-binding protein [Pseudogracilibacillus auburnensis]|uniref:ATP-binding cassette subfamily B protein n=1 Tax=Pseudogracilibacillus auburnensis TaxID=1494959 RepID=A0A2V3W8G5_9BACI|nr:ATP-binding cassette subfamily B protein [Pseudogracilibacillus auburnensis]